MSAERIFVDTNVLVYARDASERTKQPLAMRWIEALWEGRNGRLSAQVLNEYYVTVTRKLKPGLGAREARDDVQALFAWAPLPVDAALVEAAFEIEDRFELSYWDALIVAAARLSAARYLLSEDLQEGQELDGVRVLNPFFSRPEDVL